MSIIGLYAIIKNSLAVIFGKVSRFTIPALLGIAAILSIYTYSLHGKYTKLDMAYGDELSNRRQYESLIGEYESDNRVLQLKLSDLISSNDSLIRSLADSAKDLKIARNALKQASSISTVIDTTFHAQLPDTVINVVDFTIEITPNPLTVISVSRVEGMVSCTPNIQNKQDLLIHSRKEWRNKKSFFNRIRTWDWKKDKIDRYIILNSNPIIKVTDTRIINLN